MIFDELIEKVKRAEFETVIDLKETFDLEFEEVADFVRGDLDGLEVKVLDSICKYYNYELVNTSEGENKC